MPPKFWGHFFYGLINFSSTNTYGASIIDGILLGILFALIAYGMALQWGVMNIINIAQGELVILVGTLHTLCIKQEFIQHLE